MAALALTLPVEYGYVLLTATFTLFSSSWHGVRVGGFRKAAKIPYPQAYAESNDMKAASGDEKKKMYLFNCAQRAHGNFLENMPAFTIAMLIAGLRFPVTAAIMGLGWNVSRIFYAVGYTSPNHDKGQGRLYGLTFWLFQAGLIGMVGWMGVKMVI
ncbi:hypothetical protein B0A48_05200 [Cryoendolithus antarcticus]|uniref:Microsomal glutathione S-transferase 3 n=1 Tax=Cryoendolithus antarcticus TaxID=1507870 RepID=A0A1V8THU2_9PEZI|nr:hypothetical protein B0A48_05200 [Cryoendolithus antarcticus]